ncbi:hypothetical protein MINT15_23170 [Saccharomonospora viridis]|uniref:Uncharacterized protein n=1 Tax=Saccharomonospora viridis TaxID=1852 RepID=A0A837D9A6_9PSEU|nr:hypothetical protein MINT15_23170 [Saccharomonospora viridis]
MWTTSAHRFSRGPPEDGPMLAEEYDGDRFSFFPVELGRV